VNSANRHETSPGEPSENDIVLIRKTNVSTFASNYAVNEKGAIGSFYFDIFFIDHK
jgi:hypothetical protein